MAASARTGDLIKASVTLALAVFLAVRHLDGTLGYYINLRYGWLTWIGVAALAAIALALATRALSPGRSARKTRLPWLGLALLALPALLGAVPPRPLGTDAIATRALQLAAVPAAAGRASAERSTRLADEALSRNVLDWLVRFDAATNEDALEQFAGEPARVRGFVHRDERFPQGTFMVSRFLLSCCVADAVPIGLAVRWHDADYLDGDSWVWVSGTFSIEPFAGSEVPVLVASEVGPADPPPTPYLYY